MKEELTDREKQLFRKLEREKVPPPGMESEIIKKLKAESLIKNNYDMKTYLKWAAVVAAVVAAYFIGDYSPQSQTPMSYMMILQEDEHFSPGDPMEMFAEYRDWMVEIDQKGLEIDGQELKDESVLLSPDQTPQYQKGDQSVKVTGYFVFSATSMEEAIAIAQDNPHIKYGGTIQVKEFMIR